MKTKSIFAILLIVMVSVFTIQNTEIVTIKFLIWQLSISRVLVLLGCFLIGLVVGLLLKTKRKTKKLDS